MQDAAVTLEPMTAAEFDRFLEILIPGYAEANVTSGRWDRATALERSRAQTSQLLPKGRETPGHWFFTIVTRAERTPIGVLWFALVPPEQGGGGFIYDIEIDEAYRRRGYAREALLALEAFAKAQGVDHVGLHVFGYNTGAIDLYRKLGYETASLLMRKRLGLAPS